MESKSEISQANVPKAIDVMSKLPNDLREKILAYLPTKEAARTSVLSSDWRHAWISNPDLVIHYDPYVESAKIIKVVDHILALHNGPIRKFHLLTRLDETANSKSAVDRWFNHLSRNGIKELSLQFNRSDHTCFVLPSSFLACSSLSSLSINNCLFELPKELPRLQFLRTLELDEIVNIDDLDKLISSCPMLENLTIRKCYSFSDCDPKFIAPNLKKLYIEHWMRFIKFDGPDLVIDLNEFFGALPNLEILELRDRFIENVIGSKLDAGKFLLKNLKELWLDMEHLNEENVRFIQPLFHNAPDLQEFHLKICYLPKDQNFWDSMDGHDFSLRSLRVTSIRGFGCDNVLPFMKFVLRSASELCKLRIINCKHSCDANPKMCLQDELMSLKVPAKCKIIFQEII